MNFIDQSIDLNSPNRFTEIHNLLNKKGSLRAFYLEVYQKFSACIMRSAPNGILIEVGSGCGFVKEVIPNIITTDVVPYPKLDRVMDATKMDFSDQSIACICLFNALHHIPNTPAFFREANRCLVPGGRIFMVEPYAGWFSSWIYRYLHHENFDNKIKNWEFVSHGPVSEGNNALPSVIFERDRERFCNEFPNLSVSRFEPHTPLRYWLTGGLKKWSLLPEWAFGLSSWIDKKLISISPRLGSFVDIELVKI